jgi:ubiquinone/menaquinone biosynthesis C-methylase UbiE
MERDRDVSAFDRRAASYEQGPLGQWHVALSRRVAGLVPTGDSSPRSILDVGCGTGALLRELARRAPLPPACVGVDAAPGMTAAAAASAAGLRVHIAAARAEALPFRDGAFDMVVSSLSFDHWGDQQQGLAECARVLRPGGSLLLVDLFSPWLWPTTQIGRRGKARTVAAATRLLRRAGFGPVAWRRLLPVIRAAVATR